MVEALNSRRTVALAAVLVLLLVPILFGLGFALFASGLAPPAPSRSTASDVSAALLFGTAASCLAGAASRALVRRADPRAAARLAATVVAAFTAGVLVSLFDGCANPQWLETSATAVGVIAGLLVTAWPER